MGPMTSAVSSFLNFSFASNSLYGPVLTSGPVEPALYASLELSLAGLALLGASLAGDRRSDINEGRRFLSLHAPVSVTASGSASSTLPMILWARAARVSRLPVAGDAGSESSSLVSLPLDGLDMALCLRDIMVSLWCREKGPDRGVYKI